MGTEDEWSWRREGSGKLEGPCRQRGRAMPSKGAGRAAGKGSSQLSTDLPIFQEKAEFWLSVSKCWQWYVSS